MKDGNYLIGLLRNSPLSAAVWRGSWAGEGPYSRPSFTKRAGAAEERGFLKGSGVGGRGEERWEVWLRIFPHNSKNGEEAGGGGAEVLEREGGRQGVSGEGSECVWRPPRGSEPAPPPGCHLQATAAVPRDC